MENEFTLEQLKAYAESNGARCPVCGSPDIEGGPIEIEAGVAWQDVMCHHCNTTWQDIYYLSAISRGNGARIQSLY